MDLALGIPALIVVSPVLVFTALLVRLTSSGSVLFVQDRLGIGGTPFRVYKFRTLTDSPQRVARHIHPDDPDLTVIGYTLRRFKIDELPQLLNVLKGDMTLVGPRPILPIYLEEFDDVTGRRLLVRPGLTGLSQVYGNTCLSWRERWQYDAEYAERVSFLLDLWIIWRTFAVVLRGEGRYVRRPDLHRGQV